MQNLNLQCELIGRRASALAARYREKYDPDVVAILVEAAHERIPLRLQELLEADDANFAHDVFGIVRHWSLADSAMRNCFLPRFAR